MGVIFDLIFGAEKREYILVARPSAGIRN